MLYIWSRDERLLELSTSSPVVFVWEKDGKPLIREICSIYSVLFDTRRVCDEEKNVKTEVELVVGLLSKTFAKQPTIQVSCNPIECRDGKSRVTLFDLITGYLHPKCLFTLVGLCFDQGSQSIPYAFLVSLHFDGFSILKDN